MFRQIVSLIEKVDEAEVASGMLVQPHCVQSRAAEDHNIPDSAPFPPELDPVAAALQPSHSNASSRDAQPPAPASGNAVETVPDAELEPPAAPAIPECEGGSTAVAHLALRVAQTENELAQFRRRAAAAEATAQELTQLVLRKDAALRDAANQNASDGQEDREYELLAAVSDPHEPTVIHLRNVVESQAREIRNASASFAKVRAQVLALEAAADEVEQTNLGLAAARQAAADENTKLHHELTSAKKEVARLSAKLSMVRVTLEELDACHKATQRDLDNATAQILRRDNELSLLRQVSGGLTKDLRADPVMAAVSRNRWGNRAVGFAAVVDVLMLRLGRLLRGNALLRVIVAGYFVVLHVYVFNAVMVFLHHSSKMPDHVGDDVQDHLANHVHHT